MMCMEGSICIGKDPDDGQTPLIAVKYVLHLVNGLNDLFLGPKYRKISLENTLFAFFFQVPPSCVEFGSHGLRCAPLW